VAGSQQVTTKEWLTHFGASLVNLALERDFETALRRARPQLRAEARWVRQPGALRELCGHMIADADQQLSANATLPGARGFYRKLRTVALAVLEEEAADRMTAG